MPQHAVHAGKACRALVLLPWPLSACLTQQKQSRQLSAHVPFYRDMRSAFHMMPPGLARLSASMPDCAERKEGSFTPLDICHAWKMRLFERSSCASWDPIPKRVVQTMLITPSKAHFQESRCEHLTHGSDENSLIAAGTHGP